MDSVTEKKDPSSASKDEDDDLLDFEASEPYVTAFEKSLRRKPRKGRVFGRGKFGGRNTPSFRKHNAFTNLNSFFMEREREQESGTLADESSPEFCRSRKLSEDETCTFGLVPEDLLGHHERWANNSDFGTQKSGTAFLSRSSSSITASTNSSTSRRTLHRSRSVVGTSSGFSNASHNNGLSWSAMKGDERGENTDPNLDEIKHTERDRKKIRARRHSLLETLPSTAMSLASSSSTRSSLSQDPDLNWLLESSSPSKPLDLSRHLEDEVNSATAFTQAHSPTARSVASCRKRGVCGSPILSDQDDWMTLSGSSVSDRRTRSRSRIFSPPPGESLPMPPNLARCNNNDFAQRALDAMDMDDDSVDESCPDPSSRDSSFEMMEVVPGKTEMEEPADDKAKMERVFDTMSSYQDLKFLIKELRKESKQRPKIFGSADIWKVAPPVNQWSSQRRASFTAWAKEHLGFTVRSMGMGITYVQISKARGTAVLGTLEAALIEYKKTELQNQEPQESQEPLFLLPSALTQRSSVGSVTSASPKEDPPPFSMINTMEESLPENCISIADDAESLTNKIASLSMNDTAKSGRASLPRLVTLPLQEDAKRDTRLSIDSVTGQSNSRPSFDSHHAAAADLNLHLYGDSPRLGTGRPPKMSIGSMSSAGTTATMGRGSNFIAENATAPCTTVNFVTTPLMNENRGWGSRPVAGRDWGGSTVYNEMGELMSRFRDACIADGARHSFVLGPLADLQASSSSLIFTIDDVVHEDEAISALAKKEEERRNRKRRSSFNKRKRITLFATATGATALLPRQHFSLPVADTIRELDAENVLPGEIIARSEPLMEKIFSFMDESCLLAKASATCTQWADWATDTHANLLLASAHVQTDEDDVESADKQEKATIFERSWKELHGSFPWACFLAEGGAKKVYRVHNAAVNQEEAVSVMDTRKNTQVVANELAITAMLSSLVRRAICPNFVSMRGVFTCAHPPPESLWGNEDNKYPNGRHYNYEQPSRPPRTPKNPRPGRFQYIRMELVNEGDAEELIKRQPDEALQPEVARALLFQTAFALHAAADRFSVKHYDIKLLNIFVQNIRNGDEDVIMRYSLGSHTFQLRLPPNQAFMAKLADFGTANTIPASNGQPVTIAQITTPENTPPDFMILGDEAKQGHEHDSFGLGLCMLHLFTGHRPYEEILEDVKCPPNLKKRLRKIWENERVQGYSVIQSIVLEDVEKDENGHTIDGDPNEVFYDTLYRFLVLFGIPKEQFQQKNCSKVWKAITDSLESASAFRARGGKPVRKRSGSDVTQYNRDCKKFSIRNGNNKYIARARKALQSFDGGMDLLLHLCSFDPANRATALQVLNSTFMEGLRVDPESSIETTPYSYTSFATHS